MTAFGDYEKSGQFSLRYYPGTPTLAAYVVDDIYYLGMYTRGTDSAKAPHLGIRGHKSLYGRLIDMHIDRVAEEAALNLAQQGAADR